jgi:hypothetical protein
MEEYVLTRDDVIALLTEALWNKSEMYSQNGTDVCDRVCNSQDCMEIYEGVYDIMHNGTENGLSFEGLNVDKVADNILYAFGTLRSGEYEDMTLREIEAELGRKVRIVND